MAASTPAHDGVLDLKVVRTSSVEPPIAREIRMLTALLAACDPCGYLAAGGHPDLYVDIAVEMSSRLHDDADTAALLNAFPDDVSVVAASLFAGAALDWSRTERGMRAGAFRLAAAAFIDDASSGRGRVPPPRS